MLFMLYRNMERHRRSRKLTKKHAKEEIKPFLDRNKQGISLKIVEKLNELCNQPLTQETRVEIIELAKELAQHQQMRMKEFGLKVPSKKILAQQILHKYGLTISRKHKIKQCKVVGQKTEPHKRRRLR
jgi:asparagine synthetase B (glutamine-hydrolysing)